MLHHVNMIRIIKNHEFLKYDMEINNSDWRTGGPWYNTSICKKLHGKHLRHLLKIQELIGIISCVILMHMKEIINHLVVMMSAAVGIVRYQEIQQQKH